MQLTIELQIHKAKLTEFKQDFNTSLSLMDRTTRQKTNKETDDYKSTRPKRHLPAAKYIFP